MKQRRQFAAALACALTIVLGAGAVLATETAQADTMPPLLIAPNPAASQTVIDPVQSDFQTPSVEEETGR